MKDTETNLIKARIGERLRAEIKKKYGRKMESKFAKEIGIGQGTLSDILNGLAFPSGITLYRINNETKIDIRKLLKG